MMLWVTDYRDCMNIDGEIVMYTWRCQLRSCDCVRVRFQNCILHSYVLLLVLGTSIVHFITFMH